MMGDAAAASQILADNNHFGNADQKVKPNYEFLKGK